MNESQSFLKKETLTMDTNAVKLLVEACRTKRVLYVEDDLDVREQTLKMLGLYFQEVVGASDGEEGLSYFYKQSFDFIFTDINMAKMDGLAMIEEIRKVDLKIPIVVFSAYDNTEYLLSTIKLGVDGYILKPFQFKDIIETLEKILKKTQCFCSHDMVFVEGYYWDRSTQCLCHEHNEVKLTKHEIALFDLLTTSKQRIFASDEIEIAVFDDDICNNKRVRNLLSRLHQKLGCDLIQSIYGQGYKIRWLHQ